MQLNGTRKRDEKEGMIPTGEKQATRGQIFLFRFLQNRHQALDLPSGLFPSEFTNKIPHALLSHMYHVTFPSHGTSLHLMNLTMFGEDCKSRSFSLCNVTGSTYTEIQKNVFHFFILFFTRTIFKLYIYIPTNCTQLLCFL